MEEKICNHTYKEWMEFLIYLSEQKDRGKWQICFTCGKLELVIEKEKFNPHIIKENVKPEDIYGDIVTFTFEELTEFSKMHPDIKTWKQEWYSNGKMFYYVKNIYYQDPYAQD